MKKRIAKKNKSKIVANNTEVTNNENGLAKVNIDGIPEITENIRLLYKNLKEAKIFGLFQKYFKIDHESVYDYHLKWSWRRPSLIKTEKLNFSLKDLTTPFQNQISFVSTLMSSKYAIYSDSYKTVRSSIIDTLCGQYFNKNKDKYPTIPNVIVLQTIFGTIFASLALITITLLFVLLFGYPLALIYSLLMVYFCQRAKKKCCS